MTNVVGIDLGTTFSAIAQLNKIGKPEVAPDLDGNRMIASTIYFAEDGTTLVGEWAKNYAETDYSRFVELVKRHMGEEYYPYEVIGKRWTPVELSAIILAKIKHDYEQQFGPFGPCVISVPAYFDEVRRKATMDAANKAGIKLTGIVNEPTAAALYYATEFKIQGKTLVFDLGGGTFDVTALNIQGNDISIITSRGDRELGGSDFDRLIMTDIKEKFGEYTNDEAADTKEQTYTIFRQSEQLKKILSKMDKAQIVIQGPRSKYKYEITRDDFNDMIADYFSRIEMLIELVLDESNLHPKDIEQVILVGGSSRIPLVEETIEKMFGKKALKVGNMDEAVALGAAVYCGLKTVNSTSSETLTPEARRNLNQVKLTDVCNHSYGTFMLTFDKVMGRKILVNDIIIPKNSKLPCSIDKTYYTSNDNQTELDVSITQGESSDPDEVTVIHQKDMAIPGGRPSGQPIAVKYSYDENQRMLCVFRDVEAGIVETINLSMFDHQEEKSDDEFSTYLDF